MLKIETAKTSKYTTIKLIGEVDASNSVELDEAIVSLVEGDTMNLLVDGTQLEYISSAGLGVFMSYIEEFNDKDINLVIFGLNEKVFHVFHILGLDQLINIKPNEEDALTAL
ncbi:STAS domain-containing protein [Belliella marina]|uniref:Anti-sigma factor antagonist n=1 Tax=Belliella marina TaxID=1644146 RepID=A0ABW4VJL4_9BACT